MVYENSKSKEGVVIDDVEWPYNKLNDQFLKENTKKKDEE